ncbi:MAG: dienelactone hydrolase family protein [Candidatus Latescibacteria bacterium]|jgi:carboxymethylenebutenolidase|nr:dienelactone hydrolase family protein [Candidatus Latescibacterota bacterium]MBT4138851.1 dienelactone hydrolase family protein [Candidatus Latescibacterota bacterium]
MVRKTAADFDPELLDLFDGYVHGQMDRRTFFEKAAKFAVGGLTATALIDSLMPNYAWASQVANDDKRIKTEFIEFPSPKGHDKTKAYLAQPTESDDKLPAVLVVHENRGLNPYVEDVVRRTAVAGFLALGPDALAPLGGYPGTDDDGRKMQRELDRGKITEDFIAAAQFLKAHPKCNGKVGVVGFCFGGGMANTLAVKIPDVIQAAVPFYGRQPKVEDVPKIKAAVLVQNAELDKRINAGWPAYEEALKEAGIDYTQYNYEGCNHGFHNDTTPRYDETNAKLAWERTIAFFNQHLTKAK